MTKLSVLNSLLNFLELNLNNLIIHSIRRASKPEWVHSSMTEPETILFMSELNLIPILISKNTIDSIILSWTISRASIDLVTTTWTNVIVGIVNVMVTHKHNMIILTNKLLNPTSCLISINS